jgi:hypothetical protein
MIAPSKAKRHKKPGEKMLCPLCLGFFYEHISPAPFVMLPFSYSSFVRDMCPSSRLKRKEKIEIHAHKTRSV